MDSYVETYITVGELIEFLKLLDPAKEIHDVDLFCVQGGGEAIINVDDADEGRINIIG